MCVCVCVCVCVRVFVVNNVALAAEFPIYFNDEREKDIIDRIQVNCMSTVKLTKMIMPQMIER